jgi:hypothetical protein
MFRCNVAILFMLLQSNTFVLTSSYGLQCSFPIINRTLDGCDVDLLGHRRETYRKYMDGCYQRYDEDLCEENEQVRLEMNHRQPQSVYNFTSGGFRKVKTPPAALALLKKFWENNRDRMQLENWSEGNVYTVSGRDERRYNASQVFRTLPTYAFCDSCRFRIIGNHRHTCKCPREKAMQRILIRGGLTVSLFCGFYHFPYLYQDKCI